MEAVIEDFLVDLSKEKVWVVEVWLYMVVEFNIREGLYVVGVTPHRALCLSEIIAYVP